MKEITRIHIAKVPYDVEIVAKKSLEAYLKTLEAYSNDTEIIDDIEIRITEILADRGVGRGGVITGEDVTALKQQLGEPSEFMEDGAAIGYNEVETHSATTRKLYRSTDNAILGGVMSGIAAFFGINVLWIRLIFIIVALMSFGAAILVYAVLWIVVPPAKTAADKLQMIGKAVTVSSIRALNENEEVKSRSTNVAGRRIMVTLFGTASILGALAALAITGGATFAILMQRGNIFTADGGANFFIAAFILAIISGLLLSALFILLAYASFTQKASRRVIISVCIVIALGVASFGTAVGLVQYGTLRHAAVVRANTHDAVIHLPSGSQMMKSLVVATTNIKVRYIVVDGGPTASLSTYAQNGTVDANKVNTTLENGILTLQADKSLEQTCTSMWCRDTQPIITIYGPALDSITADQKSLFDYAATNQPKLAISAQQLSDVTISAGMIAELDVAVLKDASIDATNATVSTAKIDIRSAANLTMGTIENLGLTSQEACPEGNKSILDIEQVSSRQMLINGGMVQASSTNLACTDIVINNAEGGR